MIFVHLFIYWRKMREIKGYEGLYMISKNGRIFGLKRRKWLSVCTNNKGYVIAVLCKDGKAKSFYCHRLVALTFIPNPKNKPQVNHIDGDKTNNIVTNLEWCTSSENIKHASDTGLMSYGEDNGNSSLTNKQVRIILHSVSLGCKKKDLCGIFNVSYTSILRITNNHSWKNIKRKE